MKLLFITRKYPPQIGGMENFSKGLYDHLTVEKDLIALKKSQKHLTWFLPYAFFKTIFKASKYDVIFLADGALAFLGWMIKKFTKTKVVITVHGLDLTYTSNLYQKWNVSKLQSLDHVVAISESTKDICLGKGIDENKVTIIPNGVNKNDVAPIFPKSPQKLSSIIGQNLDDKKVLLTVGRLIKRKGVEWFIQEVVPRLPKNTYYLVAGSGPEQAEIELAIKTHHLEDKVFLLGKLERHQLKDLYQEADLFVMPNIKVKGDVEGFGIVALEAASYGLPIVASNIEGLRNSVSKETGVLLPEKSTSEFVQHITTFLENPTLLERKSLGAFEYANNNFTWDKVAKKYQQVFSS